jgi:hypothetical protein
MAWSDDIINKYSEAPKETKNQKLSWSDMQVNKFYYDDTYKKYQKAKKKFDDIYESKNKRDIGELVKSGAWETDVRKAEKEMNDLLLQANTYKALTKNPNWFDSIIGGLSKADRALNASIQQTVGVNITGQNVNAPTAEEIRAQYLRQKSSGLNAFSQDVFGNIAFLAPSILTKAVTKNPMMSAEVMAGTTYSSSYLDAISEGKSPEEASKYARLNTIKEIGGEYLLGGMTSIVNRTPISKFIGARLAKAVPNDILRNYLSDAISEFGEEYIQNVMDPVIRNASFGEHNKVDILSLDNLYTGLIGAASSGVSNAPSLLLNTNIDSLKAQLKSVIEKANNTKNSYTSTVLKEVDTQETQQAIKTIINDKSTDTKTKVANIDTQINDLIEQLTQIAPTQDINIEGIYSQLSQLRQAKSELTKQMTEEQKVAVLNAMLEDVQQLKSTPDATIEEIDSAPTQEDADKLSAANEIKKDIIDNTTKQIEQLKSDIETDKDIKIISNKEKVAFNKQENMTAAASIIDQMNINMPEGQKRIQIVTELNQEQQQITDLGSVFGKQVVFTENMPQSGLVSQNNPDILFIDNKATSGLVSNKQGTMLYVMGHELFHSLKEVNPDIYNQFTDYIKQTVTIEQIVDFVQKYDEVNANQILNQLKINGEFNLEEINKNNKEYKTQNEALDNIVEEMTANEFGGMITDKTYMNKLYQDNASLFNKVIDAIRNLFKSLTGSIYNSSLTQLQVEKIRNDFENVIKEVKEKAAKTEQKQIKSKETVQPAVKKETVQETQTTETTIKPTKLQNILDVEKTTEVKDINGKVVNFYRLHKDAANMVENYDYNQSNTSHVAGFGLELRNDEMYTKGKDEKDVIKTKLYTTKGMLQNDGQKIGLKRVERINKIANRYMETKGENYFGTEPIRSDTLIDAINYMSNIIANNSDNATGRKAWVEFYDNIGKDGYIKTESDGSLLAVVVSPKQLEYFNNVQKQKKKEINEAKKPTLPVAENVVPVKTSQMNLDTWFKGINDNYQRYLKTKDKNTLTSVSKAYINYKNRGGTQTIEELENIADNIVKTEEAQKKKETTEKLNVFLNVKRLPKKQEAESSFYSNTATSNVNNLFDDILRVAENNPSLRNYLKTNHTKDMEEALNRLRTRQEVAISDFYEATKLTSVDMAFAKILMNYYKATGNTLSLIAVFRKVKRSLTEAGQFIESTKIFKEMTPEAIVQGLIQDITNAVDDMRNSNNREIQAWVRENTNRAPLSDAEQEWIYQMANKALKLDADSIEYKRIFALINKYVADRIPKSIASQLKAYRRIAMLFNLKTANRNILGNVTMALPNAFADTIGSIADKQFAKKTGIRTQGNVNLKTASLAFIQGAKDANLDRKLGISTGRSNVAFETVQGSTFNNKKRLGRIMNKGESWTNFMLDLGDRPFDEMYYQNSLQNQMRLNNVTEATESMKQIALEEAQKKTYKYEGKFYNFANGARKWLNQVGIQNGRLVIDKNSNTEFGLGDVIMPFIMTPANILEASYHYSPMGLISVATKASAYTKAVKSGENVEFAQKALVDAIGKTAAGVMMYAIGFVLAKSGIISGGEDDDKDVRATMRAMGYQPFSIKLGEHSLTYDWMQPLANPFALFAELERQKKVNENNPNPDKKLDSLMKVVAEAFTIGADRLYQQSMLSGLRTIFGGNFGTQSITDGFLSFLSGVPQSFVPTLSKQLADMIDGTSKDTYNDSLLYNTFSKFFSKIPGAKSMLPSNRDILGNKKQLYGGENNIFNVMLNPANISKDTAGEIGQEIMDVYNHTGDKTIFPQVAISYIDYDINGDGLVDRVSFTPEQESDLQQRMGMIVSDSMKQILNNSVYREASYEERAKALTSLMQYSKAKALEQSGYVPGYEIKSGNASQINKYTNSGLTIGDAVMYDSMINPITGIKDAQGETIKGSENGTKAWTIMNMQVSDKSKNIMLKLISPTSKNPETVDSLSRLGTKQQFIDYYSLSRSDTFVDNNFSRDDYDISTSYFNIDGSTYTKFANEVSQIKADYDKNGEAIPNSKKRKVFNYINSLPLNQYQKLYLFSISGYSVKQWKNQMYSYINNLNISANEKKALWTSLNLD